MRRRGRRVYNRKGHNQHQCANNSRLARHRLLIYWTSGAGTSALHEGAREKKRKRKEQKGGKRTREGKKERGKGKGKRRKEGKGRDEPKEIKESSLVQKYAKKGGKGLGRREEER
jgi:hypothetical protein